MSKVAIGCVGLVAVAIVGAAGASYYAYHKVTSAIAPVVELSSLGGIDRSIRKQGPYTPPASGEPSRAQVERLLEVQRAVRARLGSGADEFFHHYRQLLMPADGTPAQTGGALDSVRLGLRISLDFAGIFVDGKRAQADALNRSGMSLEEYRWTRSRVYAALGVPFMEVDFPGIVADLQKGRDPTARLHDMNDGPAGSPAVRKLVEPHRTALEEYVELAFFGF